MCIGLAITALACGAAASVTVVDGRGKRITLPTAPKRIVSLTPSNTEILFAIGVGSRVVGVTDLCDFPPAVRKVKARVGGATVSVERVVSLHPDLVVAHSLLNHSAIDMLERLHVKVFAADPKTLAQVESLIRAVGKITGAAAAAERVAKRMSQRVARLRARAAKLTDHPRVLFAVQASPLWVCGSNTFLDEMCRIAGGVNIASKRSGFYQASSEVMIVANPDVILVASENVAYFRRAAGWDSTNAVKHGKVIEIRENFYTRTGPRLADALERLFAILHPSAH